MKDFNFLLNKKWLGALTFILFCLIYSLYLTNVVNTAVSLYMPTLKNHISDFLPVTIEDGMISKPENTLIERTYGDDYDKFKVVLDTRTEEFETSNLQNSGVYISRAAVYTVNGNKNEVRINSLRNVPNMVIDNDVVNVVVASIENYIKPVIFGCAIFWFVISGLIIMGLYSLVLHWIMSAIYKAPYRQTLRLTTYSYVIFSILGAFVAFGSTFLTGFAFALVVNFAANMLLNNQPQNEVQSSK